MKKYNTGIKRRVYRIMKLNKMIRIKKSTDGRFINVYSHAKLGNYPKITYRIYGHSVKSFKATGVERYTIKQVIEIYSRMK